MYTGEEGVLQYSHRPDGSLDLYHTEVPPSQRGRGLGGMLAEVQSHDHHMTTFTFTLSCIRLHSSMPEVKG